MAVILSLLNEQRCGWRYLCWNKGRIGWVKELNSFKPRISAQTALSARRQTRITGADPGFILGGGALVSCSTSTSINHIVFFCRIPVVLENRRSSQGGGEGVGAHPLHPPPRSAPVSKAVNKQFVFQKSAIIIISSEVLRNTLHSGRCPTD